MTAAASPANASSHRLVVCPHCQTTNRIPTDAPGAALDCGRCKAALFGHHPAELDEAGFDAQLARSEVPLVVDFWAPWCGPCRMMAPQFEVAHRELQPTARLAKVNTDDEQSLAARYNIRSIPTVAVFQSGREVARRAGAMSAADLVRWVRSVTPA